MNHYDIIAVQEFWFFQRYASEFKRKMQDFGYIFYGQKRQHRDDGVAVFVKDKYQVVSCRKFTIELGDRAVSMEFDFSFNPLVIVRVRIGKNQDILLGNTHLTFPYGDSEENVWRREQMNVLMKEIEDLSDGEQPIVICGDLNCSRRKRDVVVSDLQESGYHSCYKLNEFVSHIHWFGEEVGADYIFLRDRFGTLEKEESYLYPKDESDQQWTRDFLTSDHRPIICKFFVNNK